MENSLCLSTQSLVQLSSCLGIGSGCGSRAYWPLAPCPCWLFPVSHSEKLPSLPRPGAAVEWVWGKESGSKETLPRPLTPPRPWQAQPLHCLHGWCLRGACWEPSVEVNLPQSFGPQPFWCRAWISSVHPEMTKSRVGGSC